MATKAELEAQLAAARAELEAVRSQAGSTPVALSVRVPKALRDRVHVLATRRGESLQATVTWILEEAVETHLAHHREE